MAAESDWPALGQLLSMSRATKKMPKLDTLDALGDEMTTILTIILTTNLDYQPWNAGDMP